MFFIYWLVSLTKVGDNGLLHKVATTEFKPPWELLLFIIESRPVIMALSTVYNKILACHKENLDLSS